MKIIGVGIWQKSIGSDDKIMESLSEWAGMAVQVSLMLLFILRL
jgi:hypothetical protein